MAIYGTLEVVLKPPTERSQGVKSPRMAIKRVFPLLATSFEINILSITLQYWCTSPCIIKTQRYDCVVLCEISENVFPKDIEIVNHRHFLKIS